MLSRQLPEVQGSNPRHERRLATLHNTQLFSALTPEELKYAAEQSTIRHFVRGAVIIHRDTSSTGIHVVVEGLAKLCIDSEDGVELIHEMLHEGDWCGEVALIDGGLEPAALVAARATAILSVRRDLVLELIHRNRRLAISFAEALAKRSRAQDRRLEDLQLYDLSTRLARTLMMFAAHHAKREGDALRVDFPVTQAELASMLGATRVRVNLLLGAYQDAGIIRLGRASIVILAPDRLYRRAHFR